jgi:hypothetical protein
VHLVRNEDPEKLLRQREDLLATQIRVFGPDGGPTANARADVAEQLEAMGRFPEARLLRLEVLAATDDIEELRTRTR